MSFLPCICEKFNHLSAECRGVASLFSALNRCANPLNKCAPSPAQAGAQSCVQLGYWSRLGNARVPDFQRKSPQNDWKYCDTHAQHLPARPLPETPRQSTSLRGFIIAADCDTTRSCAFWRQNMQHFENAAHNRHGLTGCTPNARALSREERPMRIAPVRQ
jgi:hypothetical protein